MQGMDHVKKRIIISLISILILIMALFGITYAYFTTKAKGNEDDKSANVTAGKLEITYGDGNGLIQLNNIEPGDNIPEKTFTVTNTGKNNVDKYEVILEDVTNELNKYEDLKYNLSCSSNMGDCNGTTNTFPKQDSIVINNSIKVNEVQTYTLKISYDETNIDQSIDMNKLVSAKVNLKNEENYLSTFKIYGNNKLETFSSEYQEVEYIEGTGTQWINTEYIPNSKTKVEMEAEFTSISTNYVFLMGTRNNNNDAFNRFDLIKLNTTDGSNIVFNSGDINKANRVESKKFFPTIGTRNLYIVDGKEKKLTIDGDLIHTSKDAVDNSNLNIQYPLHLLVATYGTNGVAKTYISHAKIYFTKIYDNDKLVRNFVPCYRKSDGVIGLYDKVENKFYTNGGTGNFIKGADVNKLDIKGVGEFVKDTNNVNYGKYKIPVIVTKVPVEYQEVKYLESTGIQWINTEYIPNTETKAVITFSFTSWQRGTNATTWYNILGSRTSYTSVDQFSFTTNAINQMYAGFGAAEKSATSNINTLNSKNTVEMDKKQLKSNGVTKITFDNKIITSQLPIYLFGRNTSGTFANASAAKIYSCKFYDNRELVRNFVPCYRNSDGVKGLYDKVENKFYTNSGEGEFVLGEEVNDGVALYLNEPLRKVNDVADYIDVRKGKLIRKIGVIESYNGEEIKTEYISSTGKLEVGATIYYILDEEIEENIDTKELLNNINLNGSVKVNTVIEPSNIKYIIL